MDISFVSRYITKLLSAKPGSIIEIQKPIKEIEEFYNAVLLQRAQPYIKFRRYNELPMDTRPIYEILADGKSAECRGCGSIYIGKKCSYCGRMQ